MTASRYALVLAGGYVALTGPYILLSGLLAADASASVEDLRRFELYKGVAFVAVMAGLLFVAARFVMKRMTRAAAEVLLRERALRENEGRVMAGLTAASIAHDANNVLTAILGDLEELEHLTKPEDPVGSGLTGLRASAERLIALNQRLQRAGRGRVSGATDRIDLGSAARTALVELRHDARVARCDLRLDVEGDVRLETRPILVHQIVSNLVINAAEAVQGRGVVSIRMRRAPDAIALEVHDDGPGVPLERRASIFEALESTKHGGHGLGLFSVKACGSALGARVNVGDSPLGGACFRVELPLVPPPDSDPTESRVAQA